jgi:hypothetical protein
MSALTDEEIKPSRDAFEAWWRETMNIEAFYLDRTEFPITSYEKQSYACHETNRGWMTWQAAEKNTRPAPTVGLTWNAKDQTGPNLIFGGRTIGGVICETPDVSKPLTMVWTAYLSGDFISSHPILDLATDAAYFEARSALETAARQWLSPASVQGEAVAWRLTHENPEIDEGFIAVPDKNGAWAAQGYKVELLYLHPPASVMQSEGWRDIATAPKDGTDILLYGPPCEYEGKPYPERVTVGHWMTYEECHRQVGTYADIGEPHIAEYDDCDPIWITWDGGFRPEGPPTLWRSLDDIKPTSPVPAEAARQHAPDGEG